MRQAKSEGRIDREVVETYAALLLTDDTGKHIKPAPHHDLWMRLACDERIKKLLIIAPPESAKTTWLILAYLSYHVGFAPGMDRIVASVSADVATKRSLAVRTLTESPMWKAIFPDLQPVYSKWAQNSWTVAPNGKDKPGRNNCSLTAYGTGDSIIGSRADLIIADDILDADNTATELQREKVKNWVYTSLISRLKSKTGRIIMIGTAWNAADVYADIRRESSGWVICHTPLLSDDPNHAYAYISYPDNWPHKMLGEPTGGATCL